MGELRRQLIRLAHEREELRPHLLPLLGGMRRDGFVRIPSPTGFGFDGPEAAQKGKMLSDAVRSAVEAVRAHAEVQFRVLSMKILACADVDTDTKFTRDYVGLSMQDLYEEVAKGAMDYFERVPER